MGEKRVKDMMLPLRKELTIGMEQSLASGIVVLTRSISDTYTAGLVVTGSGGRAVGLLSFKEVFRAIGPKELPQNKYYQGWDVSPYTVKPFIWEGLFTRRCKEEIAKPIGSRARNIDEVSIQADETLMSAIDMFTRSGSRVLVVWDSGVPAGLLLSDSVVNEISQLVDFVEHCEEKQQIS